MNLIEALKNRLSNVDGYYDEQALQILLAVNILQAKCPAEIDLYPPGSKVKLTVHREQTGKCNKIQAIKALRAYAAWNLKDAKEFIDEVEELGMRTLCNSIPVEQAYIFVQEFTETCGIDSAYCVKISTL